MRSATQVQISEFGHEGTPFSHIIVPMAFPSQLWENTGRHVNHDDAIHDGMVPNHDVL